jgi:hypothetical protein
LQSDGSPEHEDLRSEELGRYRKHAKVYVGLYKQLMFTRRKPIILTPVADGNEYRSNAWWRLPRMEDMRRGDEISGTLCFKFLFHMMCFLPCSAFAGHIAFSNFATKSLLLL